MSSRGVLLDTRGCVSSRITAFASAGAGHASSRCDFRRLCVVALDAPVLDAAARARELAGAWCVSGYEECAQMWAKLRLAGGAEIGRMGTVVKDLP